MSFPVKQTTTLYFQLQSIPLMDSDAMLANPLPKSFGQLYRANMPTLRAEEHIPVCMQKLRDKNIKHIYLLCSDAECETYAKRNLRELYLNEGFKVVQFPVVDGGAWEQNEFNEKVHELFNLLFAGDNVVVHCKQGIARTGTIISAVASKVLGMTGDDAMGYTGQRFTNSHGKPIPFPHFLAPAQANLVRNFARDGAKVAGT